MSCLFASSFIASTRDSGSRMEIVRFVGLRFGNTAKVAFFASRKSSGEWRAQKRRSALSDLNLGIFFSFFNVEFPFSFVHVTCRDHSNLCSAESKDNQQKSSGTRLAESKIPIFLLGMFEIRQNVEWKIEKHFLAFPPRDLVAAPVLVSVCIIPFKGVKLCKQLHSRRGQFPYMTNIYIGSTKSSTGRWANG